MSKKINSLLSKEFLIEEYLNRKKTAKLISLENNIAKATVLSYLRKYNISIRKSNEARNPNIKKITKEYLLEEYVNKKKTLREISEKLEVSAHCISNFLKTHDIKVRSSKESSEIRGTRPKGKKHNFYGKINPLSNYWGKKGKENHMFGKSGCLSPTWSGGKTSLQKNVRDSFKNKEWKSKILKRDNFKCTLCSNKKDLQIDHIKPFAVIILENKIRSFDQAMNCSELFDINNGRVLCKECHKKTETYLKGTSKIIRDLTKETK